MRIPVVTTVNNAVRYGFAVGKVRVLESRVVGRATFERLLDAPGFDEQRRILSDTHYGRFLEGVSTAEGVERALGEALEGYYAFLGEAELPEAVTRFFRARYDFANLKASLKARALGVPVTGMLEDLGSVPVAAFSGALDELPAPYGDLAASLLGEDGEVDVDTVDAEVDKAMFAQLKGLAKLSRSEFLGGLASLMVDIANAKTLLRSRLAGLPAATATAQLLDGGSIAVGELAELYALPPVDAAARLARMPVLAGVAVSDLGDLRRLDVLADNVVVAYLRAARAVPLGPEPVIAYVLAREAEIVALRIVLIGKLSKIDPEVLRGRLRDTQV